MEMEIELEMEMENESSISMSEDSVKEYYIKIRGFSRIPLAYEMCGDVEIEEYWKDLNYLELLPYEDTCLNYLLRRGLRGKLLEEILETVKDKEEKEKKKYKMDGIKWNNDSILIFLLREGFLLLENIIWNF